MANSSKQGQNRRVHPLWWAVLALGIVILILLWTGFGLPAYDNQGAAAVEQTASKHGIQVCEKTALTPLPPGVVEGFTYALALDCNDPASWATVREVKYEDAAARELALLGLHANQTIGRVHAPNIGYVAHGPYVVYSAGANASPVVGLLFHALGNQSNS